MIATEAIIIRVVWTKLAFEAVFQDYIGKWELTAFYKYVWISLKFSY